MKKVPALLSVLILLLIWKIISVSVNSSMIIPSPEIIFLRLITLVKEKLFWQNLLYSVLRVFSAFIISFLAGGILGFFSGRSQFFNSMITIPLTILKTTPVSALILVLIFYFNSNIIPVISAVLMCLPIFTECVRQGIINDENQEKLYQMAEIFRFTNFQKFKYIFLPQFLPFLKAGIISMFGMCWKVTVAGEILSLPRSGTGTFLYKNQISLETENVVAVTIILILISFLTETILKKGLKDEN